MEKRNEILELSFDFALKIIEYTEILEEKRKYVIARQLLKSGTSIGANIREAQNAHSRKDFVAKCIIAIKEADETEYWLLLCSRSKNYPDPETLLVEIVSLKKILSKIISSTIKNMKS
ncbi:four helix bundle protein [Cyclobacterium xiamenense]|uniref:four helix bundle protein n=1 Tax=Cyclobacterium xiamenense TaxID=1297121 RepID=UPI0012B7EA85|nr:four helix bundle protein [Cyclobacterium xiamenense]